MKNAEFKIDKVDRARKVVIIGGSGFLGLHLARSLVAKGHDVCIISRHAPVEQGGWRHVEWNARTGGDWVRQLNYADTIINLAGRSVDCIKSPDHCDEILRSRIESTVAIGRALREVDHPPACWVQMSTAHIYGDPPSLVCNEESALGTGFAPEVGREWEAAFHHSALSDMKKVLLRTSFVLGGSGGALKKLALLTRRGLGGKIGHGRQGFSWIHEDDMNSIFEEAMSNPEMSGCYLATSPQAVSNEVFMKTLRDVLNIPFGLPAAKWMVEIGAPLFLRTDPEMALYGRYCESIRLPKINFKFKFPALKGALENIFRGP